jgi:hypothetical protein
MSKSDIPPMQNFSAVAENGVLFIVKSDFPSDIQYVTTKKTPWANLDVMAYNCFGDCYGINCKGQNAITLGRLLK